MSCSIAIFSGISLSSWSHQTGCVLLAEQACHPAKRARPPPTSQLSGSGMRRPWLFTMYDESFLGSPAHGHGT
jgi:hypothetical protein